MIYTNDHRPAHVDLKDGGRQAVFELNCPAGPVELRENFGFSIPALNRLEKLLQTHIRTLCADWGSIHGHH